MNTILVYDIVHNGRRSKVADACLDYGLDRVQYSVFVGFLARTHQKELYMRILKIVGDSPASIHLYPLDEKSHKKALRHDYGMDRLEEQYHAPDSADE